MKRIAMLIPTLDQIGGAERQVLLLAKELAARSWQVTAIALSGTGNTVAAELAASEIAYISLGMRKAWIDPRGWLRYLAWERANRPDVVHAHLPHATWFARSVRLLAPVRVMVDTIHTSHTGRRNRQLCYRLSAWLSSCVTCVSAAVAEAVLASGVASGKNLTILPNGIPMPPSLIAPAHPGRFEWIAVGRLAPVKDYPTLLLAFAALPGEPHLKILGTGTEEQSLRRMAAELQVGDRVHFAGFQRDVQPHLAAADAFVLTSLWEGLPVSVLEASAAGLPVVATEGAGTREAMLPGETGLLVPVGDISALAKTMATVMAMPPRERQAMGTRGRQFVEQHFSLPAVADRWETLYSDLLETHPRRSRWG